MNALAWMDRLAGVAVALQTIELLAIRAAYAPDGVWAWSVLRREFAVFPRPVPKLLDLFLDYRGFLVLLGLRLGAALAVLAHPHATALSFLFLTTLLIAMRWRGTYNGGSDYMTLIVLLALSVAHSFEGDPRVAAGALWYVAIQVCLSYFIAGWVKLKNPHWRNGRALSGFLGSSYYDAPKAWSRMTPRLAFALSWGVILFECGFPLALISPRVCVAYLAVAILFHLANVYFFGLNRFLFAWGAAYPALYHASGGFGSFG